MASSSAFDCNEYYKRLMSRIKKQAEDAVSVAYTNTYKDLFVRVESDVKRIYNETIADFYDSYDPEYYRRNESLYRLIKTQRGGDGLSLSMWFEPEEMTAFRNGYSGSDGLYNQVFRCGWHGGAASIAEAKTEKYGAHPNPGVPYWRTPEKYFSKWGRQADVANKSPLSDFKERIMEYQDGEMLDVFKRLWTHHLSNIQIEL